MCNRTKVYKIIYGILVVSTYSRTIFLFAVHQMHFMLLFFKCRARLCNWCITLHNLYNKEIVIYLSKYFLLFCSTYYCSRLRYIFLHLNKKIAKKLNKTDISLFYLQPNLLQEYAWYIHSWHICMAIYII